MGLYLTCVTVKWIYIVHFYIAPCIFCVSEDKTPLSHLVRSKAKVFETSVLNLFALSAIKI